MHNLIEDPSHNVGTPEDYTFSAHTDEWEINPTLQKAETRISFLWVSVLSGHPKPALSQFSHGLQSGFLLAVESEKLQTEGAWVGSPNFNLGLKEFPRLQKSLPLSDKNHKTHRYTVRGKGHAALERELPSLLTSCPWIAKRLFNATIKSFTWLNFTETLFFKKKKSQLLWYHFCPQTEGWSHGWWGRQSGAVARGGVSLHSSAILFTVTALVSEPHPATSILVIAKHQGSHTSLFGIYLNDILDEQKGLIASKWDWIEEEMY